MKIDFRASRQRDAGPIMRQRDAGSITRQRDAGSITRQRDAEPITRGSLHSVPLCLVKRCFLARVSYLLTKAVKVQVAKVSPAFSKAAGCMGVRLSGGHLCRRQKHRPSRQARLRAPAGFQRQRPWSLAAASETSLKIPRQGVTAVTLSIYKPPLGLFL